jgi:hypothetical protein
LETVEHFAVARIKEAVLTVAGSRRRSTYAVNADDIAPDEIVKAEIRQALLSGLDSITREATVGTCGTTEEANFALTTC